MKFMILALAYFVFVLIAPVAIVAWLGPISFIAVIYFIVMAWKSARK